LKIPKKVNISGIIYDVIVEKFQHNRLTEDKFWGRIEQDECKIYLNGNLNKQTLDQVFFHEILHGIENNYQIKIKDADIDRVAHGITAFLKDNNLLKD